MVLRRPRRHYGPRATMTRLVAPTCAAVGRSIRKPTDNPTRDTVRPSRTA